MSFRMGGFGEGTVPTTVIVFGWSQKGEKPPPSWMPLLPKYAIGDLYWS